MKKNTARGQVLISQINNNIPNSKNIITLKLVYNLESFRRRAETISNFFKILSNGKNTLMGNGTNRDFWNKHKCNGVYFYEFRKDKIEIFFLISSAKKLNELELKSRINKILKPTSMQINYNNPFVFKEYFNDNTVFESGFQFFGLNRTNKDTLYSDYLSV